MAHTETRNRKITHLVKASISNFCTLFDATHKTIDDIIFIHRNDFPWFNVHTEFNETDFNIIVNTFIYSDLPISDAIKLREAVKSDVVLNLLEETISDLWFYEDINLLATYSFNWKYKNYSTLSIKLIIEIYTQLQNISEIQKALTIAIEDKTRVGVN